MELGSDMEEEMASIVKIHHPDIESLCLTLGVYSGINSLVNGLFPPLIYTHRLIQSTCMHKIDCIPNHTSREPVQQQLNNK